MIYQLEIPIYNTYTIVLIEPTEEDFDNLLSDEHNKSKFTEAELQNLFKEMDSPYCGFTSRLKNGDYLMLIKDNKPYYYSHEIFHLTHFILQDRGISITEHGESYAYLNGWITEQYLHIGKYIPVDTTKLDTVLGKSLKKQGEQKPTDKVEPKFKASDWISGYYTRYKVLSVNNDVYVVEDDKPNLLKNWLKSLIPQNRWKPSEEQIKNLESLYHGFGSPIIDKEVKELIEQLKKLREE